MRMLRLLLDLIVSDLVRMYALSTLRFDAELSTDVFDRWTFRIGTITLSFILRIEVLVVVYGGLVSILNFETRCSSLAGS